MTKTRTVFNSLVGNLEDTYKFSFWAIDRCMHEVATHPNLDSAYVELKYAAKNTVWGPPLAYRRVEQIHQTIFAQVVLNTFVSIGRLLDSYLRILCLKAVPVQPADDSWFSFEDLAELSGIGENELREVNHYGKVLELMTFIQETYSSNLEMPVKTVTHNDVLATFEYVRGFVADFEAAFLIANPKVKESSI